MHKIRRRVRYAWHVLRGPSRSAATPGLPAINREAVVLEASYRLEGTTWSEASRSGNVTEVAR